jgi:hypothetical protein
MRISRPALIVAILVAAAAGAIVRAQQRPERPMQVTKVKDNLYVLRGPFNKCAPNGCGAYADDGFLHEAGDVAVRVTPQGLIVVDDKYEENAAEVLSVIYFPDLFDRLRLADLGWDRTVSTVAFKGGLKGYYGEMEAQLR